MNGKHPRWWIAIGYGLLGLGLASSSSNSWGQALAAESRQDQVDRSGAAGNGTQEPHTKLATLYGSVEAPSELPSSFALDQFPLELTEFLKFKPAPVPNDWSTRTAEQRQAWMQAFPDTAEGKAFLAEREALEKKRKRFPIRIETDGSFIVYDVPPGTYNVYGGQEIEQDQKLFALEVYGQIAVGEVDEIKMPPLPIEVTRLLRTGEAAPEISVAAWDDGPPHRLQAWHGKPVLVYFWTAQAPTAASDLPVLKAMYDVLHPELGLELLAICADEDLGTARQFVETNAPPWSLAASGGWKHAAMQEFGVRSLPQYVLVDSDGKIRLTNPQFYEAFAEPEFDMAKTIHAALTADAAKRP